MLNLGRGSTSASNLGEVPYMGQKHWNWALNFKKPDIALLMIGTNDAKLKNWNEAEYISGVK